MLTKKRTLAEIRKHLNKMMASKQIIDYVSKQIELRENKIESLTKHIEVMNRTCVPIEKRKIEVVRVDSSNSKLTINPCDGRITFKCSDKCSDVVLNEMVRLAEKVRIDNSIPPVTLRGKINFHNGEYKISMQSESKKFCFSYELESGEN